jgi:hypothetical protein
MIKKIEINGEIAYDIIKLVLDTPDDLVTLPTIDCAMGSTAIVISTAEVYMRNSSGEWIKM